jgi:hypothetical protein
VDLQARVLTAEEVLDLAGLHLVAEELEYLIERDVALVQLLQIRPVRERVQEIFELPAVPRQARPGHETGVIDEIRGGTGNWLGRVGYL